MAIGTSTGETYEDGVDYLFGRAAGGGQTLGGPEKAKPVPAPGPIEDRLPEPPEGINYIEDRRNESFFHKFWQRLKSGFSNKFEGQPVFDNSHDVPFGAGASQKGDKVFIDKHIPRFDPNITDASGQPADMWAHVAVHEQTEHHLMTAYKMPYEKAHVEATKAEKAAVEAAGIDWKKYEGFWNRYLETTEKENEKDRPPGIYEKPYEHHHGTIMKEHARIYGGKGGDAGGAPVGEETFTPDPDERGVGYDINTKSEGLIFQPMEPGEKGTPARIFNAFRNQLNLPYGKARDEFIEKSLIPWAKENELTIEGKPIETKEDIEELLRNIPQSSLGNVKLAGDVIPFGERAKGQLGRTEKEIGGPPRPTEGSISQFPLRSLAEARAIKEGKPLNPEYEYTQFKPASEEEVAAAMRREQMLQDIDKSIQARADRDRPATVLQTGITPEQQFLNQMYSSKQGPGGNVRNLSDIETAKLTPEQAYERARVMQQLSKPQPEKNYTWSDLKNRERHLLEAHRLSVDDYPKEAKTIEKMLKSTRDEIEAIEKKSAPITPLFPNK